MKDQGVDWEMGRLSLQKPQNRLVLVLALPEEAGVENQIVNGAVGHQGPALSVGDDAPGGLNGLRPGDGVGGSGQKGLVAVDLNIIEFPQIYQQNVYQESRQNNQPRDALIFHRFSFIPQRKPCNGGACQISSMALALRATV